MLHSTVSSQDMTSLSEAGLQEAPGLENGHTSSQAEQDEDRHGISPSAFLYAIQEPCVFLQKVINISGATVVMDPKAERARAAIVCSTHFLD